MSVTGKKQTENLTPEMKKLNYSKSWRMKYEIQWFVNQMFVEQSAYFVNVDGKLEKKKPPKNNRQLAKARTQLRGIKNSVTREEPRRQAKHFTLEDEYDENDRRLAMRLLQKVYREENIKEKIKDLMHNSLMKSIGFRQIYYDGEKKKICISDIDAFDVYLDPHWWLDWPRYKGRWIIKAVPTPITIANKRYGGNYETDNKTAESERKESIRNSEETTQKDSELGTVMVYEVYEKNENDKITMKVVINNETVKTEELDMEYFPIIVYQPERFAGKLYPSPWIDPIIELNKSLNRIYSSLEERIYTFSKGRWMAKRNEDISNITDQNWQIVYYDNVPPAYMQQWSPGETPFTMMGLTNQFMEDAWGIHSESMGRTSGANIRSASQISQIQAWDMQNISEPVSNLSSFLSVVWETILEMASKNITTPLKLKDWDKVYEVVGSKAIADKEKLGAKWESMKIKPFKNIKVDIIPGTSFTEAQMKQDLITLREIGIMIPDEYIIEAFKLWDTDEILSKMRLEQEKNKNPDIDIATAENKKMIMGLDVMADMTEDHRIHKAIHAKLLEAQKDNQELASRVIQHIKQHEAFERPDMEQWAEALGGWQQQPPEWMQEPIM